MNYILEKLPLKEEIETKRVLKQLSITSRALAELKGVARTMPNQNILINAIMINEAKASSGIENIVTTHDEIYKAMVKPYDISPNAKEVVDYRRAIWTGFTIIKEKGFISTNILVQLQAMIEPSKPGIRKNPGTNLVNSSTGEIIYTPPQAESEIRNLLKNLEDYINNLDDDIDPLIKMA